MKQLVPTFSDIDAAARYDSPLHQAIADATDSLDLDAMWRHDAKGNGPIALNLLPVETLIAIIDCGARRLAQDAANSLIDRARKSGETVPDDYAQRVEEHVRARLQIGWTTTAKRAAGGAVDELTAECYAVIVSNAKRAGVLVKVIDAAWKPLKSSGADRVADFYAAMYPTADADARAARAAAVVEAAERAIAARRIKVDGEDAANGADGAPMI